MLHNGVVLYRRTITFSHMVPTNQSRLRIPTVRLLTFNETFFMGDMSVALTYAAAAPRKPGNGATRPMDYRPVALSATLQVGSTGYFHFLVIGRCLTR